MDEFIKMYGTDGPALIIGQLASLVARRMSKRLTEMLRAVAKVLPALEPTNA